MGDGVLTYFGWPEARETDAERAVRAGLVVAAAVAKMSVRGERHWREFRLIQPDTAEQFAAACCHLALHGDHDGIGAAARQFVLRNHDWSVTLHGFDDLLRPAGPSEFAGGDPAMGRSSRNETSSS